MKWMLPAHKSIMKSNTILNIIIKCTFFRVEILFNLRQRLSFYKDSCVSVNEMKNLNKYKKLI